MSINCYECKFTMTCMLKRSIVDWHNLNVFYRGTIMKAVSISNQNIYLIDTGNTNKKLNLVQEDFMNENIIEILEGGV